MFASSGTMASRSTSTTQCCSASGALLVLSASCSGIVPWRCRSSGLSRSRLSGLRTTAKCRPNRNRSAHSALCDSTTQSPRKQDRLRRKESRCHAYVIPISVRRPCFDTRVLVLNGLRSQPAAKFRWKVIFWKTT